MVSRPTDPLASVGGPEKCRMKECKAYKNRCNKCNLFGHYESCCNKWTKERGRKSANDKSYQQRTNKVKEVDDVAGTVCHPRDLRCLVSMCQYVLVYPSQFGC